MVAKARSMCKLFSFVPSKDQRIYTHFGPRSVVTDFLLNKAGDENIFHLIF